MSFVGAVVRVGWRDKEVEGACVGLEGDYAGL